MVKSSVKMIVFDLDDTLLRTEKFISDRTRSVMAKCRDSGIKIVYATGRGGSADRIAPAALFDGRIVMNGAVAKVGDSEVYRRMIPYQTARPLLIACDRYGLKTTSELHGMHYSNFIVSDKWSGITNFKQVDFAQHDVDAEKLYAVVRSSEDALHIEKHMPDELYMVVSRNGLAQIMHKDATKAMAVAALARLLHIAPAEIVAFGDDLNDIDMLSFAGIGVAMSNAVDDVKAVCDFVCLSNDEDGPADWIEKNILI